MAWLLFLISPLLIAAKVVKSKHTVHHRSLQKHTVHHRSLQRQFLHGKIAHRKNHLKNHLRHKDIWKTNKHYPFPKWSPSGKQDGDPDDGHSGRCFLGIIPDIKMKQSEGQITLGKAVKKSFFQFLAFGNKDLKGRGVECKLDEQCTEVVDHSCLKNTVGLTEFPGMTTKALCYRDKGQNTCLCGIVSTLIKSEEFCTVKSFFLPEAYMTKQEQEKFKATKITMEKQKKKALALSISNLPKALGYKDSGWFGHHFTRMRNFFHSLSKSSAKQMPLWNKKDGGCLLAWEPAVHCYKVNRMLPCSHDSHCACKVGCSGMGLTQASLIWRPVCYKPSGALFNRCICGLVHEEMKEAECTWPKRDVPNHDLKDARFYSGKGEGGFQTYKPRTQIQT